MVKPNGIVIHHSATKDSGSVSWGAIRRYHVNENGWRDIGYHFGIELVGDSAERTLGRYEILMGRMPGQVGAHTEGYNSMIGICFVGNFDITIPEEAMLEKGAMLCKYLMETYGIHYDRIFGHRDFSQKTCPGVNFNMISFKKRCIS